MRDPILPKLPISVPASRKKAQDCLPERGPSDAPAAYRKWSEGSLREYFGTDYIRFNFCKSAKNLAPKFTS